MLNRPLWRFSEFCVTGMIYGTLVMITLVMHARNTAILSKAMVWTVTGFMLGFDVVLAVTHIFYANFGSRTLFHGGLMVANTRIDVSAKWPSSQAMEHSMNCA